MYFVYGFRNAIHIHACALIKGRETTACNSPLLCLDLETKATDKTTLEPPKYHLSEKCDVYPQWVVLFLHF